MAKYTKPTKYPEATPEQLEGIAPGEFYAEVFRRPGGGAWPWLVFIQRQGTTFHVANDLAHTRWGAMRKAKRLLSAITTGEDPVDAKVEIVRAIVDTKDGA